MWNTLHRAVAALSIAIAGALGLELGSATDQAVFTVTLEDANPGLEEMRNECVTVAAGAGAIQCDDYRFVYSFPSLLRLNKPRSISLIHNSALAYNRSTIGANVTIPTGMSLTQVRARLNINGVTVKEKLYPQALFPRDIPTRISFDLEEAGLKGDAIRRYTVEVAALNGSTVQASASPSSRYLTVDRGQQFGRGWWLSGYERIAPFANGDTLLWMAGDGSARAYKPTGTTNRWAAMTRTRPDTIVRVPSSGDDNAVDSDGSDYHHTTPHSTWMDVRQMTWAFWVKSSGASGKIGGISSGTFPDQNRVWWFEADNSGSELRIAIFNDSIVNPAVVNVPGLSTGVWRFVVVKYDGFQTDVSKRLTVLIDGDTATQTPLNSTPFPSILPGSTTAPFQWGRITWENSGFTGKLGEFAMYNALPTDSEVADWFANGIDFSRTGIVGGYRWAGDAEDAGPFNKDLSSVGISSSSYVTETYPTLGMGVTWQRRAIGGGFVEFDGAGNHIRSVDRLGLETVFHHSVVNNLTRLTGISVPTFSGSVWPERDTVFTFSWNGTGTALTQVGVQGRGTNNAFLPYVIHTHQSTTGASSSLNRHVIDSITAPDGLKTRFTYADSLGVLQTIKDHRGARTTVSYTHQKVTGIQVDTGAVAFSMAYQPSSLRGDSTGSSHYQPVRADSVSAFVDGPRLAAVGDTTRFWVNEWGAVKKIRDGFGAVTTVARTNSTYPGLPTQVSYPLTATTWRQVSAVYNGDGLLSSVTDNSIGSTTTYEWDSKWSLPTKVTSHEGVVQNTRYDAGTGVVTRQWLGGGAAADSVKFLYHYPEGLVTSIISPGGDTTKLGYDSLGNYQLEETPLGIPTARVRRDGMGLESRIITPIDSGDSLWTVITRDTIGRELTRTTWAASDPAQWNSLVTVYDAATKDRLSATPYGSELPNDTVQGIPTVWTYTKLGQVKTEKTTGTATYSYDEAGNVTTRSAPAGVVTMEYDRLNRMVQRRMPAISISGTTGIRGLAVPFYSPSGMTLPADTAVFTYDPYSGFLTSANSYYAQIARTYTPDGLVQTDTLRIRNYGSSGYGHVYGLGYTYDRDGRREEIKHPTWISPGNDQTTLVWDTLGRLSSTTDALSNTYSFLYDADRRVERKLFPGGGVDSIGYDPDGRVVKRKIWTTSMSASKTDWDLDYDERNKILGVDRPGTSDGNFYYRGLGEVVYSFNVPEYESIDGDTIVYDGLGNRLTIEVPATGQGRLYESFYLPAIRRVDRVVEQWNQTFSQPGSWVPDSTIYSYNNDGSQSYSRSTSRLWDEDTWALIKLSRDESFSFYGGDGKLRVQQTNRDSTFYPSLADSVLGTYEEYWYDAFGRRILRRTGESGTLCDVVLACASTIERYAWDGDQLLWETQQTGTGDSPTGGTKIGYIHGTEVDGPLGILRDGTAYAIHSNWRGLYAFATTMGGAQHTCEPSPGPFGCVDLKWPAGSWTEYMAARGRDRTQPWYGSLVMGGQDESGLLFRRNRYYDPASGRFTQEDPIGLAGGLNLYGYANGDPVNFSDPFGLCPDCIFDALSVAAGVDDIRRNGLGLGNGVALAADLVALAVPGVPGIGNFARRLFRAGRGAERVADFRSFEQARNAALDVLGDIDPATRRAITGRLGLGSGRTVGFETTVDGVYKKFRIDFDPETGAHINVDIGKGRSRQKFVFTFEGGEEAVSALLRGR